MTADHHKRDFAISSTWVLVMVVPLCVIVLWIAIDHANANRDRAQERSNRQFAKALIVTDRKFQQALEIASAQSSYSINKSVCGFRSLVNGAYQSAIKQRAKYDQMPPVERAKNEAAIKRLDGFLATQVTVPSTFSCRTLPKNPPRTP